MDHPNNSGLGKGTVNPFIPECPYPLLCRDILSKMKAQIHFSVHRNEEPVRVLVTGDLAEEYRLYQEPTTPEPDTENWLQWFPLAWAETGGTGLALHRAPVYTEIKAGADPNKVPQYPVSLEAKRGITPTY